MLSPVVKRSVWLPSDLWDRLGVIAAERRTTRAQIIRIAVEGFLDPAAIDVPNHKRIAELCEFNQLVMDLLVKRDFPDMREEILDVLDQRLGEFHA